MAKKSITRRWLTNNMSIIVLSLAAIIIALFYGVQTYFYNSAQQYLISRINAVTSVLSVYSQDSSANFSAEMRNMLESFNEKDKIELMAVNSKGRVVLTSSGFSPDSNLFMPDYIEAVSTGKTASYTGKVNGGEKIMAVCVPIASMNSEFSSVRMVISLSQIDSTIYTYAGVIIVICVMIIFFILFIGIYFSRSIAKPLVEISNIAKKYAMGDFKTRIKYSSEDEIGELCSVINNMADELSATEAMKNEFISSVSHELRTPLTAIKGWGETIKDAESCNDETFQKGIGIIITETERLQQMVEELLDFSRMQSGKLMLQMANMDILAELGDAVLIYSQKAEKENIRLTYNEPEIFPVIYGDKNRIRQVFINIIDNAIKYSSAGGSVTVSAEETDGKIRITVSDTGIGIKEADLPKVKTKFYKANQTRRGSGIGLAVADEIVTMHGGTLDVASREGFGTTVTITIPLVSGKP